jgi:hypothetical protein
VGNDGERRDPFIVAGRGTPWRGRGKQPAVMALTPLMAGQLNEGLRGAELMVGGVTSRGWHLDVLSGGRRRRDAVAARPSSGGAKSR